MVSQPDRVIEELNHAHPVSSEQVEQFAEHGFVHLRQVFSRELIEYFRSRVAAAVERDQPQRLPLNRRDRHGQSFLQVTNLRT